MLNLTHEGVERFMAMMSQETGNSGDLDGDDGGDDDDDDDNDDSDGGLMPWTMTFSKKPAEAPEQQVAPPDSDNDVDLDQPGDASENHARPLSPC